jgi:hypothetical protein
LAFAFKGARVLVVSSLSIRTGQYYSWLFCFMRPHLLGGNKAADSFNAGGEICNFKYSSTVAQAQKGANLNCRLITRLSPTLCPAAAGVYLLEKQSGRTLHTYAFLANGLTLSLTRAPRKHSRIANLDTSTRLSERIKVDARVNARRVSVSERKEAENE